VGTQIRDAETGLLLKDLIEAGATARVAQGGTGGHGNAHFSRADRQTPQHASEGREGACRNLLLTLKMIADAGLVGLPNAGKSTLLAALSRSRTRVAGYQFTTLDPHLGVVDLSPSQRITFADLPGLIEGAHSGRGLGDRFLRHIERTRLIVHVVAWDPTEGAVPVEAVYRTVREELRLYSTELAEKPEIVALSKCDLTGWEEGLNSLAREADAEVTPFSGVSGLGLDRLLARVARALDREAPPSG
jgi:GTP-binding protein